MGDKPVGSVSAKLTLDTREFKAKVKEAKAAIQSLTESLKKGTFKTTLDEWKQMAEQLKQNTSNIKNVKKELNNLKKGLDEQASSTKKAQSNLQSLSKEYLNAKNSIDAMAKSLNKQMTASQGFAKANNNLNSLTSSYNRSLSQSMVNKSYAEAKNTLNTIAKSIDATKTASKGYSQALNDINTIARNLQIDRVTRDMNKQTSAARELARANNVLKQSYYNYRKSLPTNYNDYVNYVNNQKALVRSKVTAGAAGGSGYYAYLNEMSKQGGLAYSTKGYNQAVNDLNLLAKNLNTSKYTLSDYMNTAKSTISANRNMALSFANVRGNGTGLTAMLGGLKSSLSALRIVTLGVAKDFAVRFIYSIINATGETIKNRSEMASMLNQMKLTRGEINSFNKALDSTVSSYKKMNKYSLGETVASLGVEFDLSTQEMKKAMPIVSMVQSEYIRAGRTAEEASLAVKDVLQGEFQRLSRETGVGKDELTAVGWSGNKTDLMSLLTALEKVGKSRHWDVFAQKATSLNDVLIITTNRITELISEVERYVSPVITGIFNGILSAVDGFTSSFSNLGGISKILTSLGAAVTAFATVGSAIAMYRTKLGLAQLAQLGFRQSLLATVFGIKAEEIATFKSLKAHNAVSKAIVQKITGFEAETVAKMSAKKALASYVLGLDAGIVKEYGFKTALIGSKLGILDNAKCLDYVKDAGLKWHQTLAVLTKGVSVGEAKNMGYAQSIKAIITSMAFAKVLAFSAVIIGLAIALGSLWNYCEKAKKAVEGFNDVVTNGQEYVDNAKNTVSYYEGLKRSAQQHLDNAKNATEEADAKKYLARVNNELEVANNNVKDAQSAYNTARVVKQTMANKKSQIDIQNQQKLQKLYQQNGLDSEKARTGASTYLTMVTDGTYYLEKGMMAYSNRTKSGLAHIENHTKELEKAGVSEKARLKYAKDYYAVTLDAANKWKEFEEGNIWAGASAVWNELVAMWIDISNNKDFVKLAEEAGKVWHNLQPALMQIGDALHYVLDALIVFLQYGARFVSWMTQSSVGQYLFIGTVALLIAKIASIGSKAKGAIDALKKIGEGAKSLYDRLKNLSKDGGVLDKVKTKIGGLGGKDSTSSSDSDSDDDGDGSVITTGKGKDKKSKKKKKKKKKDKKSKKKKSKTKTKTTGKTSEVGLKQGIIDDLKSQARFAVKAATGIAIAMALVTEAIYLLQAPLWALAETGKFFKAKEKSIRKGGEVLQFVSDLLASILPLVVAFLVVVVASGKSNLASLVQTGIKGTAGIITTMLWVTEAVLLLNAPLLAIASLGAVYSGIEDQVKKGADVLKLVSDTLLYCTPLMVAFAIVVIASSGILGEVTTKFAKGVAKGIAISILLVTEAIVLLIVPLGGLAILGGVASVLGSSVDDGIEAIRVVSDALGALTPFIPLFIAGIILAAASFATGGAAFAVAAVGVAAGLAILTEAILLMSVPLASLGIIGAMFPDLSSIEQGADAISAVGKALTAIGLAITPLLGVLTADFVSKLTTGGQGITDYIRGLTGDNGVVDAMSDFANALNKLEIPEVDSAKATQIQNIATIITAINKAVQSVQSAVGGSAALNTMGFVTSAIGSTIPAMGLFGNFASFGGSGDYSSGLGSKLKQLEDMVKDIIKFNENINGLTSGQTADVSGATGMVTAISDAIKGMSSTLDKAISTASAKGKSLGSALKQGVSDGMMGLSTVVNTQLTNGFTHGSVNARILGKAVGLKGKLGFTEGFKVKEATDSELRGALQVMESKKEYFYNKGYQLGQAASSGYLKGNDINSPGIMWRATISEVAGIGSALSNTSLAYNSAKGLAEAVVSGYAPTMANFANSTYSSLTSNANSTLGVMGLDPMLNQPALQQFQSDASMATGLSQNIANTTQSAFVGLDTVVGGTFANMGTNLQTTFNGINTTATTAYTHMGNTTRLQLNNMQSQTTRHIGAITNSWRGMQNALISSAEYIRSQTGAKINQLESNMASFWRKVQNPTLLMGSAGDLTANSTRTPISNKVKTNVVKTMNSSSGRIKIPSGSFGAGGYSKTTGISNSFKPRKKNEDIDFIAKYLACLDSGGTCYAGGWSFDWSDDIRRALLNWKTNFGAIYDPYLSVGKFENDDFPVRGIPEVFKGYVYDAISRTSYEKYFNSKTGGDPIAAYSSGSFNCYDGALIIMALASAFGFSSTMRHGKWGGIPHVWAHVNGVGDIDATAIQNGYGFTSPKVSGIGTRGSLKHPDDDSHVDKSLHLTVNVDMRGATVSDSSVGSDIGDVVVEKIIDLTGVNKNTGR